MKTICSRTGALFFSLCHFFIEFRTRNVAARMATSPLISIDRDVNGSWMYAWSSSYNDNTDSGELSLGLYVYHFITLVILFLSSLTYNSLGELVIRCSCCCCFRWRPMMQLNVAHCNSFFFFSAIIIKALCGVKGLKYFWKNLKFSKFIFDFFFFKNIFKKLKKISKKNPLGKFLSPQWH